MLCVSQDFSSSDNGGVEPCSCYFICRVSHVAGFDRVVVAECQAIRDGLPDVGHSPSQFAHVKNKFVIAGTKSALLSVRARAAN